MVRWPTPRSTSEKAIALLADVHYDLRDKGGVVKPHNPHHGPRGRGVKPSELSARSPSEHTEPE